MRANTPEDFWGHVDRSGGPDACWPWKGSSKLKNGYGRFNIGGNGKKVLAHRFAYRLAHGTLPDTKHVLHLCDNHPCCNPAHLRLGTHQENVEDMVIKKRNAFGSRSGAAKLNEEIVAQAKRRLAMGESQSAVARALRVHSSQLSRIASGKYWRHVQ